MGMKIGEIAALGVARSRPLHTLLRRCLKKKTQRAEAAMKQGRPPGLQGWLSHMPDFLPCGAGGGRGAPARSTMKSRCCGASSPSPSAAPATAGAAPADSPGGQQEHPGSVACMRTGRLDGGGCSCCTGQRPAAAEPKGRGGAGSSPCCRDAAVGIFCGTMLAFSTWGLTHIEDDCQRNGGSKRETPLQAGGASPWPRT